MKTDSDCKMDVDCQEKVTEACALLLENVRLLEQNLNLGLTEMVRTLVNMELPWKLLEIAAKKVVVPWDKRNWRYKFIRTMTTRDYKNGGDRRSNTFKGAQQQAIVKFIEEHALAADGDESDEIVADKCANAVEQRWRAQDLHGQIVLRQTVRIVSRSVRSELRSGFF